MRVINEPGKYAHLEKRVLMFSVFQALYHGGLSTFKVYGKGWITRVFEVYLLCVGFAQRISRIKRRILHGATLNFI